MPVGHHPGTVKVCGGLSLHSRPGERQNPGVLFLGVSMKYIVIFLIVIFGGCDGPKDWLKKCLILCESHQMLTAVTFVRLNSPSCTCVDPKMAPLPLGIIK